MSEIRYRRDDEGARRRVALLNGKDGYVVRWTESCSGCLESGECGGNEHSYPYDNKAQCRVGAGCDECGHTGKRRREWWVPFDPADDLGAIP
jgi:hypothetical protein